MDSVLSDITYVLLLAVGVVVGLYGGLMALSYVARAW